MPDAVELTRLIKKAALEAVDATKPADICFGEVLGTTPLQILMEQKLVLGKEQLILPRNMTDYEISITVNWNTENRSGGSGEAAFESHNHAIAGKKTITVHNGLAVGDKVILIRKLGGQKFLVYDRIKE